MAIAALAIVAMIPGAVLGAGADPALDALRRGDAYISPRALGRRTAIQERRLAAAAAQFVGDRRPVKLAVVLGPVGSPTLQFYARRLVAQLDYEGTLVITTTGKGRRVAVAGPRPAAETTRALRARGVGEIGDPVTRLVEAAEVSAPPPVDLKDAARHSLLVLIAIGVIGGGWAAAIGAGRRGRRSRRDVAEARGRARVCIDALRAHALALARRPDLSGTDRARVERALGIYADATAAFPMAVRAEEVSELEPKIRAALDDIAATRASLTGEPVQNDPFVGLCGMDPAHGVAVADSDPPLCERCLESSSLGPLSPRMLFEADRPVRFDLADYGPLRPTRPA